MVLVEAVAVRLEVALGHTPARVAMGAGKHAHTNKTRSKAVGGVRHAGDAEFGSDWWC